MNKTLITAIGSGAYFPIQLTQVDGKTTWQPIKGDTRLINQNLLALLSTQIGERFRSEYFGTRVLECLEEPNTQALQFLVVRFIKESISTWEPRIEFLEAKVNRDKATLKIQIRYKVIMDQNVTELNFSIDPQTNKLDIL